jgi:hypothetical protein
MLRWALGADHQRLLDIRRFRRTGDKAAELAIAKTATIGIQEMIGSMHIL